MRRFKEYEEYLDLKPVTDEELEELLDEKPKKRKKKREKKLSKSN